MGDVLHAFRGVFRNRQLRRVELAAVGGDLAAFAYVVVLAVVIYHEAGTGGVGVLMLVRMLAAALTTPFTSALADRYPRKFVMAGSNLLTAGMIAIIAVAVNQGANLAVLCVLTGIAAVFAGPFRPTQQAILPSLARTPEELTAANAVATTIEAVSIFLGPGIGGILLGVSGPTVTFGFTCAGLLWAALLVLTVHEPPREAETAEDTAGEHTGITAGIRLLLRERTLLAVVAVYAMQTIVGGGLTVFNVVLALRIFDLGNSGVGYLDSAFGVGGIIGGVLAAGLSKSRRLGAWFAFGATVWGVGIALLGVTPVAAGAFIIMAGVGIGNTVIDVAAITLIQRSAPAPVLARVFGAIESVLLTGLGVGAVLAPALIALWSPDAAMIVIGLALPASAVLLSRPILRLDAVDDQIRPMVDLLRGTPIFSPMAVAALEQVARNLEHTEAAEGHTIITEGDPGDLFYVIAEGTAEVTQGGTSVAQLGAGDFFGEIALLRDTPRTATVTARSAMKLLTLEREQFLAAVTGQADTSDEADLVVAQRLSELGRTVATH